MNKIRSREIAISLVLFFFFPGIFYSFAEERITLTTYYPAPYGVYKEMRADRMAIGSPYRYHPTSDTSDDGTLIVSGKVGIGTASPSSKLHIVGTGTANTPLTMISPPTNHQTPVWR